MSEYDAVFQTGIRSLSLRAAERVVPMLIEAVRPAAVVDVGCGLGMWLSVFAEQGIDVHGVDGDYVPRADLLIDTFTAADLAEPLELGRRFDLAMSVEVAEHLPEAAASMFVAELVDLAPVVAFSAAIPHQGGVGHVNERWPDYWSDLFGAHGYQPFDIIRPAVWSDPEVVWWYAQNLVVYAKALPGLSPGWRLPPRVVHPECWVGRATWVDPPGVVLRGLGRRVARKLRR